VALDLKKDSIPLRVPRSLAFGDRGGIAGLPGAHPLGQLPASQSGTPHQIHPAYRLPTAPNRVYPSIQPRAATAPMQRGIAMRSPNAAEFVESFGPTPLEELTARVPSSPTEVAEQINDFTSQDILEVTDDNGKRVNKITPEQAENASFVVQLTPSTLRKSLR